MKLICNNIQHCKKGDECPHASPHEHRDDCCEADCCGSEVNCREFIPHIDDPICFFEFTSKNEHYSPFEDPIEYHESFT